MDLRHSIENLLGDEYCVEVRYNSKNELSVISIVNRSEKKCVLNTFPPYYKGKIVIVYITELVDRDVGFILGKLYSLGLSLNNPDPHYFDEIENYEP